MTTNGSAWNAIMQYSFIKVFATDGVIDEQELAMLRRLALEDGDVDPDERAVLSRIFSRVNLEQMDSATMDEIRRFKTEYSIP